MEYKGFIITNRRYSPSSPRVWAALKPRLGNTTFGDIIATGLTESQLHKRVDAYVASVSL